METQQRSSHVILTSHPGQTSSQLRQPYFPILWGAADPLERGPVVATFTHPGHRNAIGSHSGSYTVYRALAMASGALSMDHRPDLTNTAPVEKIGPFPSWGDPEKIVSIDPWGAVVADVFQDYLKPKSQTGSGKKGSTHSSQKGVDIRPSIAVTRAHINMAEITEAIRKKRLEVDGEIIRENHDVFVSKVALEPVWYLPAIAKRFGVAEGYLRKVLFQETGGMFPELVTRPDLKILLPPIGSTSVYIFGPVEAVADPKKELTVRVHDECNGSDVFGSDICTCRPYLVHGIEEAIKTAQRGGSGVVVYYRKEGRALGEVTKFLVYNARKRQHGGDSAASYFHRTECVAGVQDMRFQELMPDVLHWLGIQRIDHFISMSDMKYNAITKSGIQIVNRVNIPPELIPQDAWVEMEAKKAAGYYSPEGGMSPDQLKNIVGRGFNE